MGTAAEIGFSNLLRALDRVETVEAQVLPCHPHHKSPARRYVSVSRPLSLLLSSHVLQRTKLIITSGDSIVVSRTRASFGANVHSCRFVALRRPLYLSAVVVALCSRATSGHSSRPAPTSREWKWRVDKRCKVLLILEESSPLGAPFFFLFLG